MSNWLPDYKIEMLLKLVSDGMSNRKIAKIMGISRTTVRLYAQNYWKHCKEEYNEEHTHSKGGYWYHRKHL